ncbi:hypothetical protein CNR22_14310 [Sphingobacteriaceae bacterium]|nr:hypothetical protein CNR22_14310 [Sphingobacteriaceae bacterium]
MSSNKKNTDFKFLKAGGETGELIRNFDWSSTPVGSPETWPAELKNALRLMLSSPIAMCIMWGKDYVQFYNDAFIPSFGKTRHPGALGAKVENTSQRWPVVKALFEKVMSGETIYMEDSKILVDKNGYFEECFFNVSYIPIYMEDGTVGGVQSIVLETTDKVNAAKTLQETEARVRLLIQEAPVATALFVGKEMLIDLANDKMIEIWGKGKSVIGMPLAEALPELKEQSFLQLLDDVFTTGKSFEANGLFCELLVDGKLRPFYFDFTYKAVRNTKGEIYGVMDMAVDVTEQVLAKRKTEKSQQELLSLFEESPVGIARISSENLVFKMANRFYGQLVGRRPDDIIGKSLLDALPELKGQGFEELLNGVLSTGVAYTANEVGATLLRNNVLEKIHVDLTYQPIREEGLITGILIVATDVTQQVAARKKVEESEAHLQLMRDTVPAMIFYVDEEERYQSYNGVFMKWFNVDAKGALGKTIREFIGDKAYDQTRPNLRRAYGGEQVTYQMYAPSRMEGDKWLSIVYTPDIKSDGKVKGIIVHATDITEHILTLKKIEESELFSRDVIHHSPVAKIVYTGKELTISVVNKNMLQLLGRDESIIGKTFVEAIPELAGSVLEERMNHVFTTGETFVQSEEKIDLVRFGKPYTGYYTYTYKVLRKVSGEIYGMMAAASEITDQVLARQQIENKEKELRDLITAAPIGIAVVIGKEAKIEDVNERFVQISGKSREQFKDATYWDVFPEVAETYGPALEEVFETGIKFRSEEAEMVLIRRGVHEKIFATFDYVPIFDSYNKVSKVIILVIEVTHQVETRKQIETAVIERTKELDESNLQLKRSNSELEQFAYIASHDLQEPVRKISTFTQMLEHSIPEISEKSKNYISKIYTSTDRMSNLIRDVLAFSQLSQATGIFESVDLSKIIKGIEVDFELQIQEKEASIEVIDMPVVNAISSQMTQLFSNLMSNSLKYTRPGVAPVIKISASPAKKEKIAQYPHLDGSKKYHHIQFIDNGIGFDQEHADRIFKIFQRLHGKTEYEGTGIGLSICRKILQTHNGHITAEPGENEGALFTIFLPLV